MFWGREGIWGGCGRLSLPTQSTSQTLVNGGGGVPVWWLGGGNLCTSSKSLFYWGSLNGLSFHLSSFCSICGGSRRHSVILWILFTQCSKYVALWNTVCKTFVSVCWTFWFHDACPKSSTFLASKTSSNIGTNILPSFRPMGWKSDSRGLPTSLCSIFLLICHAVNWMYKPIKLAWNTIEVKLSSLSLWANYSSYPFVISLMLCRSCRITSTYLLQFW